MSTPAKKLVYNDGSTDGLPVQVESAIRDSTGLVINTNYQKKPKVIEYTVPGSVPSNRYVIATDDNYDGSPRFIRIRLECVSSSYTQIMDVEIGWAKNTNNCSYVNILGMTVQYGDLQYIGIDVPNNTSYYTSNPPQIHVYNNGSGSREKKIKITILDSNCDLTWKTAWDTVRYTTNMSTLETIVANGYKSNVPYASYATSASSATTSSYANYQRDYFRIGQIDSNRIMAVADDGIAYCVNDTTKKFTLPIKMYVGRGYSADTSSHGYTYSYYNQGSTSLSYLSDSSLNNLTVPTWTASDGDKTLYLRGSIDSSGCFVCDGNVTLSMAPGYTYIPFGKTAPNYSGSTAQAPTLYTFNAINTDAYTLNESGKLTHINGIPVPTGDGVQLLNTTLTFSLITDTADPFYDAAFPYRAALTDSTITANTYATVTLSSEQATSGYYSSNCRTDTGVLYLYANTDVGQQTIPTINLGGGDTTTSTIDSAPTSGSGNAVSSNGVYTNCVRTTGAQDILTSKTFKNNTSYSSGTQYTPYLNFASDNSGNIVGRVAGVRTGTTSAGIYLEVHNPNTNAWMNGLTVSTNGTNSWVTAPYRAYDASNTEDVVTIGSLKPVEITGLTFDGISGTVKVYRSGNVVQVILAGANISAPNETYIISGLPRAIFNSSVILTDWATGNGYGLLAMFGNSLRRYGSAVLSNIWLTVTYLTDQ